MSGLDLSILVGAVDKFTAPAKRIVGMSDKLSKSMLGNRKAMDALENQKGLVGHLGRLGKELGHTATDLQRSKAKTAELGRAMAAISKPTKKMTQEFERAKQKTSQLKSAHAKQTANLRELRRELRATGVDTRKLGDAEARLGEKLTAITKKMQKMAKLQAKMGVAQSRYDQALQRSANITLMAGGIENAGRKMVGALTAPVEAAISFESVMADVKKVVNFDSPEQFKAMRKDILALSTAIPISAKGLGDIIAAAGQANIPREQLLSFADAAAKMGVAFDLTGEQSGAIMAGWRTSLSLTQQQTNSLADAVNHLSNNMNANAGDLAQVISRQGAVAKAAGLTNMEIASLGAALLSSGAAPEIAATGMKNMTLTLSAGTAATKAQSDALDALGLDAVTMSQRMQKDAKGAILDVFKAMASLDKAKQPAILKELFGLETVGAIAPLLANIDNVKRAFDLIAVKAAFAGSAQQEFEVRSKTTENAMQLFNARLERMKINFGDKLLPVLNRILNIVSPLVDGIGSMADRFPLATTVVLGLIGVIGGIALVLAPVITAIASLTVALAFLRKGAIKTSIAAQLGGGGLGGKLKNAGGFLKGKGGMIGAAVAALSIGATLMSDRENKAQEITKDLGGIGGALAGAAAGAAIGSVVPVVGTFIGGLIGSIAGGMGGNFAGGVLASLLPGASGASVPRTQLALANVTSSPVAPPVQDNSRTTIHINQQPGEDGEALARRITDIQERNRASDQRSRLYD